MHRRDSWSFYRFIEEILHLSEIVEIPGIKEARTELIKELWIKFPKESKDLGLSDFG